MKRKPIEVPDLSKYTKKEKEKAIKAFCETTVLYAMQLFVALGLKDGIYYNAVNDVNGDKYRFIFEKVKEESEVNQNIA